jgi:hypothetical protein
MQEVGGSIPPGSTNPSKTAAVQAAFFVASARPDGRIYSRSIGSGAIVRPFAHGNDADLHF